MANPNYSPALAVSALVKAARPDFKLQIAPLVEYLRTQ